MRGFRLKIKQRPEVRVRDDRPVQVPFVLMADTVLMANTVMSDYTIKYEAGMGTKVTLKEKTRPMLTVMREEEYILQHKKYDVTFTITEGSTPLEDVRIVIDGVEAFTNSYGIAVFRLKNGTYTYQLTKTGYITVTDDVTVNSANVSKPVGMSADVGDPIQVLVDEYKAYVTSQGGEHGVSDAALYAEYEDMVTAGEITDAGVNTKSVVNFGLWGFKKDGSDLITHFYGLVKVSGNYPVYEPTNSPKWNATGYFEMYHGTTGAIVTYDVTFGINSFYEQLNSHIQYISAALDVVGDAGNIMCRNRTGANNRCAVVTYEPAISANSSNNFFLNDFTRLKWEYNRFNDGAEKVSIKLYQDGVLFQTMADREFGADVTGTRRTFGGTVSSYNFKTLKAVLL